MSLHDKIAQLNHGYPGASFQFRDGYELAKNEAAHIARQADADIDQARQIITDLVEYAECNDPGNPHLARAKGFIGGEHG